MTDLIEKHPPKLVAPRSQETILYYFSNERNITFEKERERSGKHNEGKESIYKPKKSKQRIT